MENCELGSTLRAKDRTGAWLKGKIVELRGEGDAREVKIHFLRWRFLTAR